MSKFRWPLLVMILVSVDQLSKWLVETRLPFHQLVEIISFIGFFRTYNEGIAFSFLQSFGNTPLIVLTVVIIGFVVFLWNNLDAGRFLSGLGFALVLGGAFGNLVDRLVHGKVIDFILFHTSNWSFAVFNLADSFITMGAVAIVLDEILTYFGYRRAHAENENKQGTHNE